MIRREERRQSTERQIRNEECIDAIAWPFAERFRDQQTRDCRREVQHELFRNEVPVELEHFPFDCGEDDGDNANRQQRGCCALSGGWGGIGEEGVGYDCSLLVPPKL